MLYLRISIIFISAVFLSACSDSASYISFGNNKIELELARTEQELYRGLSGRDSLCENCGMLFVFKPTQKTGFVMRDMNFALDMVGIRAGRVVAIDTNCQPEANDNLTTYQAVEEVDYVLELNAGMVKKLNIKVGDEPVLKLAR